MQSYNSKISNDPSTNNIGKTENILVQENINNLNSEYSRELFIANLSKSITEIELYRFFSVFSEIEYVKINNNNSSSFNTAKVVFFNSEHANEAKIWTDGVEIDNSIIKVLTESKKSSIKIENPSNNIKEYISNISKISSSKKTEKFNYVNIVIPTDLIKKEIIDNTAYLVAESGEDLESRILDQEKFNPLFDFLHLQSSKDYLYYRWRTIAFAMGDSLINWRENKFLLGNTVITPPPIQKKYLLTKKNESNKDNIDNGNKQISQSIDILEAFQHGLKEINIKTEKIFQLTIIIFNNLQYSRTLLNILVSELKQTSNFNTVVSIFYLLNDIIYNSMNMEIANTWIIRRAIKRSLSEIIYITNEFYNNKCGLLSKEGLKEKVNSVINNWSLKYNFLTEEEVLYIKELLYLKSKIDKNALKGVYNNNKMKLFYLELKFLSNEQMEEYCKKYFVHYESTYSKDNERKSLFNEVVFYKLGCCHKAHLIKENSELNIMNNHDNRLLLGLSNEILECSKKLIDFNYMGNKHDNSNDDSIEDDSSINNKDSTEKNDNSYEGVELTGIESFFIDKLSNEINKSNDNCGIRVNNSNFLINNFLFTDSELEILFDNDSESLKLVSKLASSYENANKRNETQNDIINSDLEIKEASDYNDSDIDGESL